MDRKIFASASKSLQRAAFLVSESTLATINPSEGANAQSYLALAEFYYNAYTPDSDWEKTLEESRDIINASSDGEIRCHSLTGTTYHPSAHSALLEMCRMFYVGIALPIFQQAESTIDEGECIQFCQRYLASRIDQFGIPDSQLLARLERERAKVLATIPAGHPPETEAPDGVLAEYREGGRPDGHPLTANYFLTNPDAEVTWGFKNKGNSFLSKQYREGKLTLRVKVGTSAAYAYNYRELLAAR